MNRIIARKIHAQISRGKDENAKGGEQEESDTINQMLQLIMARLEQQETKQNSVQNIIKTKRFQSHLVHSNHCDGS